MTMARIIVRAVAFLLGSAVLPACVSTGPTAPSITKVEKGMSVQQVETLLGGSAKTYQQFGHECRIYSATTQDRQGEKPHYVLFRDGAVIDFGEGSREADCFQALYGR